MIVLRFDRESLAHLRFAVSPLTEVIRSVHALDDPGAQALHLPWAIATRRAVADLDLAPLRELVPADFYTPDFTSPPPRDPLAELEDEVQAMLAVPPDQVRAEVVRSYGGRPLPPALEPFVTDPAGALADLAGLVRGTGSGRSPSTGRGSARSCRATSSTARASSPTAERTSCSPTSTRRSSGRAALLRLHKRATATLDVGERGLLLMPSVFVWPRVVAVVDPAWPPAVVYPARGIGTLWDPGRAAGPEALAALLGAGRAAVLAALHDPWSTTDLAARLGVSAGGVSQHLRVLREAGLVRGHRVGRTVLYRRSPAGDTLVAASRGAGG